MRFGGTVRSLAILRNTLLELAADDRHLVTASDFDDALDALRARSKSMGGSAISSDARVNAVKAFWESKRITTFKDARLVAFSLALPIGSSGESILDNVSLFDSAIRSVDGWRSKPHLFRRCYHGLVSSYFDYDCPKAISSRSGPRNWITLRDYLGAHIEDLSANEQSCPEWVLAVREFPEIFTAEPFSKLSDVALNGEHLRLSELKHQLLIGDSSWFSRELFFAKLRAACLLGDAEFVERLPALIEEVEANSVLHDEGLGILLDRYASGTSLPVHRKVRDHTVFRWGNPWLAANTMRWGNVREETRKLLSEWLKLEFIESFFTLLAEDGHSDKRRMEFWKRYVNEINHIHFALGADAQDSRVKDFVELRRKARDLTVKLGDGPAQNNAFIMTMGDFVVVEFSGRANALYIYSTAAGLPFDVKRTVFSARSARNSLKNTENFERLGHQDGIHGFDTWEERFEATLSARCRITPGGSRRAKGGSKLRSSGALSARGRSQAVEAPRGESSDGSNSSTVARTSSNATGGSVPNVAWFGEPFSADLFDLFCTTFELEADDRRSKGGSLWVHNWQNRTEVSEVLEHWGFRFKVDRGAWWRQ